MLSSRKTSVLLTDDAARFVDGAAHAAVFSPKYIEAPEVRYDQFHVTACAPQINMPAITAVTSRGLNPCLGSRRSKKSHSAPRMRVIAFSDNSEPSRFTRTNVESRAPARQPIEFAALR